jgi:hypothetical protein
VLEAGQLARPHKGMHAVEAGIRVGVVCALVRSAALLPLQAGGRDEACEGKGIAGQLAQAGLVALKPGQAP